MLAAAQNHAAQSIPMLIKHLGCQDFAATWRAMQAFTAARDGATADEIWLLEHPPIFTLGLAGKRTHILRTSDIPILPIDRGGQVTYHGPGQVIAYVLLDLKRRGYGVRELVQRLEQAVLDMLGQVGVCAERQAGAPGIYIAGQKIAALGLRIKRGMTYHGLALNVDMDLKPFSDINPCGYAGMPVTQLKDYGVTLTPAMVAERLASSLRINL